MLAITFSTAELELLRRCFAAGRPKGDGAWKDQDEDEELPIRAEPAELAASLLAAAQPDQPIEFREAAWEAFALCCEVGAELLDESRDDGLSNAQYEAVVRLVGGAASDYDRQPSSVPSRLA